MGARSDHGHKNLGLFGGGITGRTIHDALYARAAWTRGSCREGLCIQEYRPACYIADSVFVVGAVA